MIQPAAAVQELVPTWRSRAELLRRHGAIEAAETAIVLAEELETVLASEGGELLKLRAAARLSGYSEDYLARLIKRGALRDYGRPHAPRVRRDEVPIKPGHVVTDDGPGEHVIGARGRIARAVAHSDRGD